MTTMEALNHSTTTTTAPHVREPHTAVPVVPTKIEVRDFNFYYGETKVLHEVG